MCGFNAYNKENDKSTDATNFDGGIPIPDNSTTISIVYLCVSIKSIYTWLNVLENYFTWRGCAYQYKMKEIFKQIPTKIRKPTPEYFKKKCQAFLTYIGGG